MTAPSDKQRWAKIPEAVIRDGRLSCRQVRVLMALFLRKGKDSEVWPSRAALAEITGIAENKISTITSELEGLGWLVKRGDGGRSRATRYTLKTLPELGTVMTSETVPNMGRVSDPKTLPNLGRDNAETLPDLGRGIEQTSLEQQTTGEFSPMSYDELMKASRGASRRAHIALYEERLRLSGNAPSDAAGDELMLLPG